MILYTLAIFQSNRIALNMETGVHDIIITSLKYTNNLSKQTKINSTPSSSIADHQSVIIRRYIMHFQHITQYLCHTSALYAYPRPPIRLLTLPIKQEPSNSVTFLCHLDPSISLLHNERYYLMHRKLPLCPNVKWEITILEESYNFSLSKTNAGMT